MKIVIAPDSFKGTATAPEAAAALAEGWAAVRPGDTVVPRPMADGGEGTLAAIAEALPGTGLVAVPGCTGPDGRPVDAQFAVTPDRTGIVELARTSGLPLMSPLDPLRATTRGTGEVVAAALDLGVRRLLVGLGGSASTDGGTGLLSALGVRLLDARDRPLPDGGGALTRLRRIDRRALRATPEGGVLLLTDVVNPLLGADGAACVYGPQKGADPAAVDLLERGLEQLSRLLGGDPGRPGAGAAGGTAYGLAAAWGAATTPGAAAVAELLGLDDALSGADLVITGEGHYDATSLRGKVVGEVTARAARAGVPVRVVAGDSDLPGVTTLTALAGSGDAACRDAARWLRHAGESLARGVDMA